MKPPTIADILSDGIDQFSVTCGRPNCMNSVLITFDDIGLPDETPFPEIPKLKRFRCSKCRCDQVSVMPDWRMHLAQGAGRSLEYRALVDRDADDLTAEFGVGAYAEADVRAKAAETGLQDDPERYGAHWAIVRVTLRKRGSG